MPWLQNLLGKLGGGSESSVGSGVVASVKEVYELYLHILMTLGILWQLFAHRIPQHGTKHMPTEMCVRGPEGEVVVGPYTSGPKAQGSLEGKVQRTA